MTFQGSLKELHLPDVIQLISVSAKSGAFELSNEAEKGVIYLDEGRIVHASVGRLEGDEAIYTLATWNEGFFRFVPGEVSVARTITKNNTSLLMEAARRMDEWRILSKRIPSLDHVPRFQVPEGKRGQINLNTREWMVLSKIDGKTSISSIAELVKMTAFDVAKLLYGLVTMGLIVMDEPASSGDEEEGAAPKTGEVGGDLPDAEILKGLRGLLKKLREVANEVVGETEWPSILRAYRKARTGLDNGRGTDAVQTMCQDILEMTTEKQGQEAQVNLAQRFRDVLSSWNQAG